MTQHMWPGQAGKSSALSSYALHRGGGAPVFPLTLLRPLSHSVLVLLPAAGKHTGRVIRTAIAGANGRPLVFVYLAEPRREAPQAFQFGDPYRYDTTAQRCFSRAATLAQRAGVSVSFVYRVGALERLSAVWRVLRPDEVVVEAGVTSSLASFIAPDYVRYSFAHGIRVAHYRYYHLALEANECPTEV